MHRERLMRMVTDALDRGHATQLSSTVWEIRNAGRCKFPVTREFWSSYDQEDARRRVVGNRAVLTVICELRCRKCDTCRKERQVKWAMRARAEYAAAARTWFGTLTVDPEHHMRALSHCRVKEARSGVDYDALALNEQFRLLAAVHLKECSNYLKRIRKNSGSAVRFLLVAERHKSGQPHFHMLLHEVSELQPVRKALLDKEWPLGFTHWRLVHDEKAAGYVCKYLGKNTAARVRASLSYGETTSYDIARNQIRASVLGETTPSKVPLASIGTALVSEERNSE